MNVTTNTVVSLRFVMKNQNGDIMENTMDQPPVEYLHGAGNILPALELGVEGLQAGDKRSIVFKMDAVSDDYQIDMVIDAIRPATLAELKAGKPEQKPTGACGPGCCC